MLFQMTKLVSANVRAQAAFKVVADKAAPDFKLAMRQIARGVSVVTHGDLFGVDVLISPTALRGAPIASARGAQRRRPTGSGCSKERSAFVCEADDVIERPAHVILLAFVGPGSHASRPHALQKISNSTLMTLRTSSLASA